MTPDADRAGLRHEPFDLEDNLKFVRRRKYRSNSVDYLTWAEMNEVTNRLASALDEIARLRTENEELRSELTQAEWHDRRDRFIDTHEAPDA